MILLGGAFAFHWFGLNGGSSDQARERLATPSASYVGGSECAGCHHPEFERWQRSHHALAMQAPSTETVLGDFSNAAFVHNGRHTSFFRRDDQFIVRAEGPDGRPSDFPVKYTFGWLPLQQYLLQLPGGRLQALSVAWDSRKPEDGGARWFDLYPNESIDHLDPLHWTGPYLNWNYMCSDCHSTNVRHNFDAATNRFDTRSSELNVSCEACHGPGSAHVAWAQRQQHFWSKWTANDPARGLAVQLGNKPETERRASMRTGDILSFTEGTELKACAVCHSRRTALTNEFLPAEGYDQHYLAALLSDDLYYVDGQIKDEVFEYNSFRQSRMFAKGVTCSDCHDPHSAELRGNTKSVCLQCHDGTRYDVSTHHHHEDAANQRAPGCVDCHMPQRTYMVVDPRRDHSFRVPRPDLTVGLGVPNACQKCHAGQPEPWAAARVKEWLGRDARGFQDFAGTLHAVRQTSVGAEDALRSLLRDRSVPPIVKGSVLADSGQLLHAIPEELPRSLDAPAVAERLGALQAIAQLEPEQRWRAGQHLLEDSQRSVRIEAARILLDAGLTADQRKRLAKPLGELLETATLYASRPQWRMIAATVHAKLGQTDQAIENIEAALAIQPSFAQGYANLADVYRSLGQEDKVHETLTRALAQLPNEAALHYAMGLHLVRSGRTDAGIEEIKQAVRLGPDDPTFAYGYALGLYSRANKKPAFDFLAHRIEEHPTERRSLYLLAQLAIQDRRPALFEAHWSTLEQLGKSDPIARQLADALSEGLRNSEVPGNPGRDKPRAFR
jgi:predicted CXXCH cytochrome family protein